MVGRAGIGSLTRFRKPFERFLKTLSKAFARGRRFAKRLWPGAPQSTRANHFISLVDGSTGLPRNVQTHPDICGQICVIYRSYVSSASECFSFIHHVKKKKERKEESLGLFFLRILLNVPLCFSCGYVLALFTPHASIQGKNFVRTRLVLSVFRDGRTGRAR